MTIPVRDSASSSSSPSSTSSSAGDPVADEFYIGYAPPMPPRLAGFVRRAVSFVAAGVPLVASIVALGHIPLDGGVFDYGRPRAISGVITTRPYPAIRIGRDTAEAGASWALLVAPGKHGADALVAPFDGRRATLDGTRIERGGLTMFEVAAGSIRRDESIAASEALPAEALSPEAMPGEAKPGEAKPGERVTLRGEIVDGKCFLGVMVPGEGKTHKDCASLCLRGGIPPALVVRDREGRSALLLLVSESGDSLAGHPAALTLAGEPVEITGVLADDVTPAPGQGGTWRMLRTNPATWRPLAMRTR